MNGTPYKLDFGIEADQKKTAIRQRMLSQLRKLTADDRAEFSADLIKNLQVLDVWRRSTSILLFHPLKSEPDIIPLLDDPDRSIFLPRVTDHGLDVHEFNGPESLRRSEFGMLEPNPETSPVISTSVIDLAIIPGLAFDPSTGVRLGRGGGYYDRLLASPDFTANKLGVCFEFQLENNLPSEPHDQRIDQIVSNSSVEL